MVPRNNVTQEIKQLVMHSKLGYMSLNEFEAANSSREETKLNSVKCCKKSTVKNINNRLS